MSILNCDTSTFIIIIIIPPPHSPPPAHSSAVSRELPYSLNSLVPIGSVNPSGGHQLSQKLLEPPPRSQTNPFNLGCRCNHHLHSYGVDTLLDEGVLIHSSSYRQATSHSADLCRSFFLLQRFLVGTAARSFFAPQLSKETSLNDQQNLHSFQYGYYNFRFDSSASSSSL